MNSISSHSKWFILWNLWNVIDARTTLWNAFLNYVIMEILLVYCRTQSTFVWTNKTIFNFNEKKAFAFEENSGLFLCQRHNHLLVCSWISDLFIFSFFIFMFCITDVVSNTLRKENSNFFFARQLICILRFLYARWVRNSEKFVLFAFVAIPFIINASDSHWLMSHVPIPVNYLIFWHTFPHSTVQIAASGAVLCSYRLYNLRLCIRTLSLYETDICRIISSYSARDRQMLWQCNHAAICAASLYHSIRWKTILGFTNCTTNIWSVHA